MPLTPITKETFDKQGWIRVAEQLDGDEEEFDFYYKIGLPKVRTDEYAMYIVSNNNSERGFFKEMGVKNNEFVVNIENSDGLGFCRYEEEIEVLYKILTGIDIYSDHSELDNNGDGDDIFISAITPA